MPRPNRLKLSASGGSIPIKNLRPGASPKRGISHEHPYIGYTKLIGGKIMNGTNKSRLVVQALRRRLLRRGMNSPRTPKTTFSFSSDGEASRSRMESAGNSPILLPQLPPFSLSPIFPGSPDSACSSSLSSPTSCSTSPSAGLERPPRRYILPDPSSSPIISPSDLNSAPPIRMLPLPPLRFHPFDFGRP